MSASINKPPTRLNSCFRAIGTRVLAALPLVIVSLSAPAEARSRGIAGVGCEGCHGFHGNSSASLSPLTAELGTQTTLRFTISDPDARVAGVYIEVEDTSALSIAAGQQLAVVFGGIAHTSPREFSGGQVTYEVLFDVPQEPGVTHFVVSSLAADGNGRNNSGDEGNIESFDVVYGCAPQTYFRDLDGDGYGQSDWTQVFCESSVVEGFSPNEGDCNDNSADAHPNAEEFCNRKDDDCDGEIDEDALPVELYPDADGDGFYSQAERSSGEMVIGCLPYEGFADRGGDCDPDNPDAHPDAVEVCDGFTDEDCDGDVDDRVRPICGIGWCRRESYSCDIEDCTPGAPVEERCNFLDDDCDDEVDEGDDLCPPGEQCLAGECRSAELGAAGGGGNTPDSGSGATNPGGGSEGAMPVSPWAPAPGGTPNSSSKSGSGSCGWGPRHEPATLLLLFLSGALWLGRRRAGYRREGDCGSRGR